MSKRVQTFSVVGFTPKGVGGSKQKKSQVANIKFLDEDLDDGSIMGYVTWELPPERMQVTHYVVYLSNGTMHYSNLQLGRGLPILTVIGILCSSDIGLF